MVNTPIKYRSHVRPLQKCLDIQRSSLTTKKSTFGDVSVEVADTLELIGSLEMTQGCLRQAHRTMTKVNTTPHEQQKLLFALVTTYKCTLEMLQTAKGNITTVFVILPEYLGGFNQRLGVSGRVRLHQWEARSDYTHTRRRSRVQMSYFHLRP